MQFIFQKRLFLGLNDMSYLVEHLSFPNLPLCGEILS